MLSSLEVNEKTQQYLEQMTVGQSENNQWFKARKNRLTASNFGAVCKRRPTTKYTPLIKKILYSEEIHSYAIQHGKINESEAIRTYEKKGIEVRSCGLFVDMQYGFLAASPDGLIDADGIIEVKCPYFL